MSRTKLTAASIMAVALGAAAASAAPQHEAMGKIERINPKGHEITVGHRIYRYNPRLVGHDLKRGALVRVFYRTAHGRRIAEEILPPA